MVICLVGPTPYTIDYRVYVFNETEERYFLILKFYRMIWYSVNEFLTLCCLIRLILLIRIIF